MSARGHVPLYRWISGTIKQWVSIILKRSSGVWIWFEARRTAQLLLRKGSCQADGNLAQNRDHDCIHEMNILSICIKHDYLKLYVALTWQSQVYSWKRRPSAILPSPTAYTKSKIAPSNEPFHYRLFDSKSSSYLKLSGLPLTSMPVGQWELTWSFLPMRDCQNPRLNFQ